MTTRTYEQQAAKYQELYDRMVRERHPRVSSLTSQCSAIFNAVRVAPGVGCKPEQVLLAALYELEMRTIAAETKRAIGNATSEAEYRLCCAARKLEAMAQELRATTKLTDSPCPSADGLCPECKSVLRPSPSGWSCEKGHGW